MMATRRDLLHVMTLGGAGLLGGGVSHAAIAQHEGHDMSDMEMEEMPEMVPTPAVSAPDRLARHPQGYVPIRTLNGWTLPYKLNNGVKEFHLVAEAIEHEFAPGSYAKCWGYNGSTPGPTIEAVEGDRVRIFVTNRLGEPTTVHWHGIDLPNGYDGVGGLNQPHIRPGETYAYEFTLRQHGSHMYHPHADEMTQMAFGMMGLFIIHPKNGEDGIARDYAFLLHNWALHPGTYRPDPAIMQEFNLWTFNSKAFPAIEHLVARTNERIRIRVGNLSMWNHPIHLHGNPFWVTGGDGGRWPNNQWRREVTEIVGVGQMRDIEYVAIEPGDWALHCHMAHHTMGPMGHTVPNPTGVDQRGVEKQIRETLPGYMAMGADGMSEHSGHLAMGMLPGPANTLPMMTGTGQFGAIEMGGMFTVVKVRDDQEPGDYTDPGWYRFPKNRIARRVSSDPGFGDPPRRAPTVTRSDASGAEPAIHGVDHTRHGS
jgi:manganese oxidase